MLTIYEQIQEAVDLIETDLSGTVTAAAAARCAGMSLRSFHRYFPALTGYRFGEYARKRRLSAALDRLRDCESSILSVAIDSGYDSHEAFTRAFKNEFGITPSRFRRAGGPVNRVGAIDLVGEVMMGVLTKFLWRHMVVNFLAHLFASFSLANVGVDFPPNLFSTSSNRKHKDESRLRYPINAAFSISPWW